MSTKTIHIQTLLHTMLGFSLGLEMGLGLEAEHRDWMGGGLGPSNSDKYRGVDAGGLQTPSVCVINR